MKVYGDLVSLMMEVVMGRIEEAKEYFDKASLGYTYGGSKRKEARKRPLSALSSIIDTKSILSRVDLGLREICLERVKGTYYHARSNTFADDFIPRFSEKTEFGVKWINLCAIQIDEGIRDPILVYEYMNYYYVQEGNKRVSVLKYFEAATVFAKVVRLIPPYDAEEEKVRVYYSFLEFFAKTNFEDIWFSNPCGFEDMIELMDQDTNKESYKEYLRSYFIMFRRIFKKFGRDKHPSSENLTTGDIYLTYCRMFGVDELDEDNIKKRIGEVVSQCIADKLVEVDDNLTGAFSEKTGILNFRKLKVAFVFPFNSRINGWAKDHWRSYMSMKESFGKRMIVDLVENVMDDNSTQTVLNDAAEKYDVLFLIDSILSEAAEKCAVDYPKTTFLMCEGIKSTYLLPNYYGKTYQANFLLGLYGAMIVDGDKVGYVSKDMNHQIYRSMCAFEAGFRSIRPKIRIQYAVSDKELDDDITMSAYYRTVVTSHFAEGTVNTYLKKKGNKAYKAYTYWQWKMFYERIFARLADGSFRKLWYTHRESNDILFFHWGLGTDVIGIHINDLMPTVSSALIFENIKTDIIEGRLELSYLGDTSKYKEWCKRHRS